MNGVQVVVDALKREGVKYIFGYPGGACMPIFDALLDAPELELVLVRHEQGGTHMADGYARATGKPGVVLVTSGPGATNTVTGLLTAQMDSIPLIVLTGQTITPNLGKDAFQEADIFGVTMPVVKHSYLVKDANDLPKVMKEAFHLATTGRPGPVLIDLPKDVVSAECTANFPENTDLPGYEVPMKGNADDIVRAADIIMESRRPLLYVGAGAVGSGASKEVLKLAEKLQAPVTTTLLGKGAFPETHELSVGMLGMHGTAYANKAVVGCDMIMAIGARWDDRITGKVSEFCPTASKIHIDIDPAEFGKIIQPDVSINGDARLVLQELIPHVHKLDSGPWLKSVASWKKKYPLKYPKRGGLRAQYVLDELDRLSESRGIISTDVGQHQMWAAQYFGFDEPNRWMTSGGLGTMGYGLPAAMGVQVGNPDGLVIDIAGEASFMMNMQEMSTLAQYGLPVKMFIINNEWMGMVRQWQELIHGGRYSESYSASLPDFIKLAESFGMKGLRANTVDDLDGVIEAMLAENGPVVADIRVAKEENCFPMIPSGAAHNEMLLGPNDKAAKPVSEEGMVLV